MPRRLGKRAASPRDTEGRKSVGSLAAYHRKRHFDRTPEPRGRKSTAPGSSFVVQKHAARRLHYDFRLELDGVLKSWAVPKGPSVDPAEKRLAVHVEDHPLDYGGFQGVIPKGEYGGGPVLLWDRGHWIPDGDPRRGYRRGKLVFRLDGEKLRGGWVLVRTSGGDGDRESWILRKLEDDEARPGHEIVVERPESVDDGRTIEEIEAAPGRIWHSDRGREGDRAAPPDARGRRVAVGSLEGARRAGIPDRVAPELATLVAEPPGGDLWWSEIKFDGYRVTARIDHSDIRLFTRRGEDWTRRFPSLARSLATLGLDQAVFDGEVVVLGPDGKPDFQGLQNVLADRKEADVVYYVFDCLHADGYDVRASPLSERKRLLASLVADAGAGNVVYSDHVVGNAAEFYEAACGMELEGIVCKRADRPYRSGRTGDWLKVKCRNHQELVIGGFTEPGGGRSGFGALLVGAHEHGGGLRYCGRVGTGFSGKSLRELRERLRAIERRSSPFVNPPRGAAARGVHWVEPELVCQVEFAGWTQDRMLRAPSFKGLREDKPAAEVRIEAAVDAPPMPSAAGAKKERRVREPKAPVPAAGRKARDAVDIAGVRLTHPDRVLYPEQGITKHALALYYLAVAERILPYVARRPVTLLRCPEGHEKECFVQRHANALFPESVPRFELEEKGKKVVYPYVDSARSLIGLVQLGVLEIHPWGSRIDDLERPDRILFDLDPDVGLPLERVTQAAVDVRERLQSLGLSSFVKTTGGKGLHVVVPIAPRHGWDVVKEFCAAVARAIARDAPDRYVVTAVKAKRTGKLFIDYLRNTRSATAVAAYSTRARARAPVSVPLRWEELAEGVRPDQYTIENLPRRLSALRRDPWADYDRVEQSIESAVKRLSRT